MNKDLPNNKRNLEVEMAIAALKDSHSSDAAAKNSGIVNSVSSLDLAESMQLLQLQLEKSSQESAEIFKAMVKAADASAGATNIMAKESIKPWYKKPEILFSLTATLTAVCALIFTSLQYKTLSSDFALNNRPYLTLDLDGEHDLIDASSYRKKLKEVIEGKGQLPNEEKYRLTAALVNRGKIPAKFKVEKKNFGYPDVIWEKTNPEDGIIFPDQKIALGWSVGWDRTTSSYQTWVEKQIKDDKFPFFQFIPHVIINYGGVNEENMSYHSILSLEMTLLPENLYERVGRFSWKIIDAN